MSAEPDPPPHPTARTVGGRGLRRRPEKRAGRPVLDPDVISDHALRLLTESGIDAVTMSRVSRDLGVTVRAIYHWVPSRAALLEAAALRAQETLPVPERSGDWRADLRRHRDAMFAWLDTHPGVLDVQLIEGITAVGPRVLDAHEAGLALFTDIGFGPRRARLLYAEYAGWVGGIHHFYLRPLRRSNLFEQVVAETHAAAEPRTEPLTTAAGTLALDERIEEGFAWMLDNIESTLGRPEPKEI
ncbi:TetR/AcrR family transcriptional regulator [Pseudonocardia sp. WMMC193]|uniref:TetR/AcrR family transcriptional regulator n=1 Tax=Pseudonocardia sp. WMMC193 TaxID=2911965 RepID=UPI001F2A5F5C|nr:TetR family transcriptional regulator [Pseudonocardia sp. WMMC193]MCF7553730.1 TetR/AcrR family transcriptional regulator [Pseudonocardia sp. WMMC193]